MDRPRSVGIAWYEPGDYPRILEAMADSGLPGSYATWLMSATQVEREVARSGVEVRRVRIEPEAFLEWCRAQDRAPDAKARAAFVQDAQARG
ncbi:MULTISPECIES: hypothetical protein [Methylobacterium]|jgi:hypothetical protein|uniref:hypothetical protein n=1 Tax=Methylobacterium TaxID=407 RepID=UPI0008E15CDD|nr:MULTISPECIES: hypothetical protein [Methylobacterium]MBZ6414698.1 hypothetical protein [Methylobacterium sp.]MBK3398872.1 hypothetical protein [Methylobacterium ajmalii]MBK3409839.1 hypothetical protein [Methylobacterium ajmalii]MBK3421899.1 hypothetical protein [Methylobacterium ajmalii]SFE32479.1 hypothetical protein SAMN04487844_102228 [Methylobacterium sp. yr596]